MPGLTWIAVSGKRWPLHVEDLRDALYYGMVNRADCEAAGLVLDAYAELVHYALTDSRRVLSALHAELEPDSGRRINWTIDKVRRVEPARKKPTRRR